MAWPNTGGRLSPTAASRQPCTSPPAASRPATCASRGGAHAGQRRGIGRIALCRRMCIGAAHARALLSLYSSRNVRPAGAGISRVSVHPLPASGRLAIDLPLPPMRASEARGDARGQRIQRRAAGNIGQGPQRHALLPRAQAPLHLLLAQLAQQVRQRESRPGRRGCIRRTVWRPAAGRRHWPADVAGCQHAAHRARIDPAVGVAADLLVDRAVVHAGTAADAAQHLTELAADQAGTAAVDQHEIHVLRAIALAFCAWSGQQRK